MITKDKTSNFIGLIFGSVSALCVCTYSLGTKIYYDAEKWILLLILLLSLTSLSLTPTKKLLGEKWCGADIAMGAFCSYSIINIHQPFDISIIIQILTTLSLWLLMRVHGRLFKPLMIVGLALSSIVQTVIAIAQKNGCINSNHAYLDVTGSFGNSGPLGGFMAICLVWLWTLSFSKKLSIKTHFLLKIICCIALVGILLAESRAAGLAVVVGILLYHIYKIQGEKLRILAIVISVLLLTIMSVYFYFIRPSSADARLTIWKTCWNQTSHPIVSGYGTASFSATYMYLQIKELDRSTEEVRQKADDVRSAFNESLQLYYENGLIGCFLFLIFLYFAARNQFKLMKHDDYRTGIFPLFAYLVFSQFSYPSSVPPLQLLITAILAADLKGHHNYAFFPRSIVLAVRSVSLALCLSCIILMFTRVSIYSHVKAYCHFRMDSVLPNGILPRWVVHHDPYLLAICAQAQMLVGDEWEALRTLNFLQAFVHTTRIQMRKACIYESLGKIEEALRCYRLVQAMRPGLLEPLFAEFQLLRLRYDLEAHRLAERIVLFNPKINNSRTEAMKAEVLRYLKSN